MNTETYSKGNARIVCYYDHDTLVEARRYVNGEPAQRTSDKAIVTQWMKT